VVGALRFILALFGLRHKSSGRETPQQALRHLRDPGRVLGEKST